jgi:polysaccharide pyruvyl transferase WcaK-like protein
VPSDAPFRICVVGNFSGRNSGDAAILGGLLRDITATFSGRRLVFDVPTINPRFVRETYREFPVRAVSLLPTNLSLKILGVPIVRSVLGADLVLVTDAILFDRKLSNPLFNYLHTLSWVLPWGARRGVPIVLYNVSLGPVTTPAGRTCLARVLRSARRIILRDRPSVALAAEIAPDLPAPVVAADCALSTEPSTPDRVEEIARRYGLFQSGRPVLGFNVNAYVDVYVRGKGPGIGAENFQRLVASVLDRAVRELGVDVLLIVTQPMDLPMVRGVLERVEERAHVQAIGNPELSYRDIAGVLGRVDAFVGMRTHSLILASSMHTPLAGIIAYAKNRGYLESIDRGDGMLEFADFSAERLWELIRRTWTERDALRKRLAVSVERERARARGAALELSEWLGAPATDTRPARAS